MNKNGLAKSTISTRIQALKQLAKITDLENPEATKTAITNRQQWNKLTQRMKAEVYEAFLKYLGKSWQRPRIKPPTRLPFDRSSDDFTLMGIVHCCIK